MIGQNQYQASSNGYSPHNAYQNATQNQQQQGFGGFKLGGVAPPEERQRPRSQPPKRWTVQQLRASDAIIPLQSGTNQFASQRGMTGFGQPRNTTTPIYGGLEIPRDDEPRPSDAVVPLQYGTNQYASQRGMTGFGAPRDVTGKHLHSLVDDEYVPEQPQWQ